MANRSTPLLLEALSRAAGGAEQLVLGKNGLFPGTAAGKQAAREAQDQGWLRVCRSETRGKAAVEYCRITAAGLDHLLQQSSPRPVLEQLLQALTSRGEHFDELLTATQVIGGELHALRATVEQVLSKLSPAPQAAFSAERVEEAIVAHLDLWEAAAAIDDCPLPDLYERVNRVSPLTIGQFHDALRQLCQDKKLYLHPWTGPLYAMPQPQFATFTGHQVAYYASLRAAQISQSA